MLKYKKNLKTKREIRNSTTINLTPLTHKIHFNYIPSYYFKLIKYCTSEKQSMRLDGKIPPLEFFTLSIVGKTILMDGLFDS